MQFSFVTVFFLNSRFLSLERQMNICIMSQYKKKNTNFEVTGINLNIKPSVNSFLSCMSLAV